MKLIKPSIEVVPKIDNTSLISLTKEIEIAARNCYKSEDKIADGTDIDMCNKLINRHHYAMLEFGDNIILRISNEFYTYLISEYNLRYTDNVNPKKLNRTHQALKHFVFTELDTKLSCDIIMSGNLRAYIELNNLYINNIIYRYIPTVITDLLHIDMDLNYMYEDEIEVITIDDLSEEHRFYHETLVARVICDRGVSHELVRHEGEFSFAQESTRYCNYGNDHVSFIIPSWLSISEGKYSELRNYNRTIAEHNIVKMSWFNSCIRDEEYYNQLLNLNLSPQEARSVLPNSLKTEIVMKGTLQAWYWLFHERTASGAHPQMKELMIPFYEQVKSINKYLTLK